ncbi:MAG: hypothetical protein PHR25_02985 [Clostridia bacterium]|nr:hypothetical protein [Clostridia bacterium]MDD4375725.1 hypothetical protein [Clostridia bacterium]
MFFGHTIRFDQKFEVINGKKDNTNKVIKEWLIYKPDYAKKSDNKYEMMNLETGSVVKIEKEKIKLFFGL